MAVADIKVDVEAAAEKTGTAKSDKGAATAKEPGNSAWLTAGIIVADVVGAGILSMPVAVAKFGWLLGAILIAVLLAMNVHISILLWRVKMHYPQSRTYKELVENTYALAPPSQRKAIVRTTVTAQSLFIVSILGVYALSWGRGFGMLFYNRQVCLPVWALLGCLLLIPFHSSARSMGGWKSLVWINIVALMGTIVLPLAHMAAEGSDVVAPEGSAVYAFAPLTTRGVFAGLGIFSFGFTSQFILTEVISEMRNPEEFPKAYAVISAPFQCVCFLVVGIMGYCYMGDKVKGMIVDSLPFGPLFRVAAVCLIVHMVISYLIKSVVVTNSLHKLVDEAHAHLNSARAWAGYNGSMLFIMLVSWTVACVVPFFEDLVDLLGASLTPLCCFVVPILCYLRLEFDLPAGKRTTTRWEYFVLFLELNFAFILMVVGTQQALSTIAESWDTYGYPFECHCEDMWDTCACSAGHAGMDYCAAQTGLPGL